MFSGTILLALSWLAGIGPSAGAHPARPQATLRAHLVPLEPQRDTTSPCPCEPSASENDESDFEDEQEHRSSQAWPAEFTLRSASCRVSVRRNASRGQPLPEGLCFGASVGLARGPPAQR